MPETITLHALDLSGETTLKMFLRKDDGTLLNADGDALTEISSSGVFTATLGEARAGLGTLSVRVCDGTETADNLLIDDFLPESSTVIGAKVNAELDSAARVTLAASQPDYDLPTNTELNVALAASDDATLAAIAAEAVKTSAIKAVTDKINTGLVLDGAVYQFTANMLELAPAGGGGGGSGDATLAKQEEILAQLDVIQTKTDTIGSVGAITSLLAAAVLEPGTITSFPETLTIGDSYTEQNGREIQIPIVDTDGNPVSSTGSLNFADASVTFTLQRSGETDSTRVITGTATFVDPPGTGTGAGAPYAVIELPASETAKGLKKYKYSGILTFLWTGTGTDVMSFETGTVTFDN